MAELTAGFYQMYIQTADGTKRYIWVSSASPSDSGDLYPHCDNDQKSNTDNAVFYIAGNKNDGYYIYSKFNYMLDGSTNRPTDFGVWYFRPFNNTHSVWDTTDVRDEGNGILSCYLDLRTKTSNGFGRLGLNNVNWHLCLELYTLANDLTRIYFKKADYQPTRTLTDGFYKIKNKANDNYIQTSSLSPANTLSQFDSNNWVKIITDDDTGMSLLENRSGATSHGNDGRYISVNGQATGTIGGRDIGEDSYPGGYRQSNVCYNIQEQDNSGYTISWNGIDFNKYKTEKFFKYQWKAALASNDTGTNIISKTISSNPLNDKTLWDIEKVDVTKRLAGNTYIFLSPGGYITKSGLSNNVANAARITISESSENSTYGTTVSIPGLPKGFYDGANSFHITPYMFCNDTSDSTTEYVSLWDIDYTHLAGFYFSDMSTPAAIPFTNNQSLITSASTSWKLYRIGSRTKISHSLPIEIYSYINNKNLYENQYKTDELSVIDNVTNSYLAFDIIDSELEKLAYYIKIHGEDKYINIDDSDNVILTSDKKTTFSFENVVIDYLASGGRKEYIGNLVETKTKKLLTLSITGKIYLDNDSENIRAQQEWKIIYTADPNKLIAPNTDVLFRPINQQPSTNLCLRTEENVPTENAKIKIKTESPGYIASAGWFIEGTKNKVRIRDRNLTTELMWQEDQLYKIDKSFGLGWDYYVIHYESDEPKKNIFSIRPYLDQTLALTADASDTTPLTGTTNVKFEEYTGSINQQFSIQIDADTFSSPMKMRTWLNPDITLGLEATNLTNGTYLTNTVSRETSNADTWVSIINSNFDRHLFNVATGKVLDDFGHGQADNGAKIGQWDFTDASGNNTNQQWEYEYHHNDKIEYHGWTYNADELRNKNAANKKSVDPTSGGSNLASYPTMQSYPSNPASKQYIVRTPSNVLSTTLPIPSNIRLTDDDGNDINSIQSSYEIRFYGSANDYTTTLDYVIEKKNGEIISGTTYTSGFMEYAGIKDIKYIPGWNQAYIPDDDILYDKGEWVKSKINIPYITTDVVKLTLTAKVRSFKYKNIEALPYKYNAPCVGPIAEKTFTFTKKPDLSIFNLVASYEGLKIGYAFSDTNASRIDLNIPAFYTIGNSEIKSNTYHTNFKATGLMTTGQILIPWTDLDKIPIVENDNWPNDKLMSFDWNVTFDDGTSHNDNYIITRPGIEPDQKWNVDGDIKQVTAEQFFNTSKTSAMTTFTNSRNVIMYYEISQPATNVVVKNKEIDNGSIVIPQRSQDPDSRRWVDNGETSILPTKRLTFISRPNLKPVIANESTFKPSKKLDAPISGTSILTVFHDGTYTDIMFDGSLSHDDSITMDSSTYHASGTLYSDVSLNGGSTRDIKLQATILNEQTDMLIDAVRNPSPSVYRTPYGAWIAVVITSVEAPRKAARYAEVTIEMTEIDPDEIS